MQKRISNLELLRFRVSGGSRWTNQSNEFSKLDVQRPFCLNMKLLRSRPNFQDPFLSAETSHSMKRFRWKGFKLYQKFWHRICLGKLPPTTTSVCGDPQKTKMFGQTLKPEERYWHGVTMHNRYTESLKLHLLLRHSILSIFKILFRSKTVWNFQKFAQRIGTWWSDHVDDAGTPPMHHDS